MKRKEKGATRRPRVHSLVLLLCLSVATAFGQTLSTSPNPSIVGSPVTISVYVSGVIGTIIEIFDVTGSSQYLTTVTTTAPAPAFLAGSVGSATLSSLAVGTHRIQGCVFNVDDCSLSGNIVSQVVNKIGTSVSVTASPNPANIGQIVALTAILSQSAASGTVTFSAGSATIGTVPVSKGFANYATTFASAGTYTVTATYNGDAVYAESSGTTSETINSNIITTTTTLSSSANPSTAGQSVILTANVSPAGATGTVTILNSGTAIGSTSLQNGSASFQTSPLPAGTYNLAASYGGDTTHAGSTSQTLTQTVNKSTPSIVLTISPNPATFGTAVTLNAATIPSAATGTVTFFEGGNTVGIGALSNGSASLQLQTNPTFPVGSHTLTAFYGGDNSFNPVSSAPVTEIVTQGTPTPTFTTLTVNPAVSTMGSPVSLTAAVSPSSATGTIAFLDSGSLLGTATLTNGAVTTSVSTLSAGSHSLTASYGGSSSFASSVSSPVSVTVNPQTNSSSSCTYALSAGSATVGAASSTGTVNVTAPAGCPFTASAPSGSFAAIIGGAVGSGSGTVTYSVQANSGSSGRATTLTIGGLPFTINQLNGCVFGLTPSGSDYPASGGSNVFTVGATGSSCSFTASASASFLIVNGSAGSANSSAGYTVLPNSSSSSRDGTIVVTGLTAGQITSQQTFTVVQAGTSCSYSLAQASQAFTAAGGSGTVSIQAPAGCPWNASAVNGTNPFVTITGGASGSGNGLVSYSVPANATGSQRTNSLTISGTSATLPYVVTQSASSLNCTASVPSAPQIAIEGRTEVLGDLVLTCSGLTAPLTADISVTLNTNVTNAISGGVTDATLLVNGLAAGSGAISGNTTIDWAGVSLAPVSGTATVRITNVRADASLLGVPGNLQSTPVTGLVNISAATPVPVSNGLEILAYAAPSLVFQKGTPTTQGTSTTIPLQYGEAGAAAFHAAAGNLPATRLRLVLTNVPSNVQVFAPLFNNDAITRAQLFTTDSSGFGGSAVAGSPGQYQQIAVSGGVATATWVVQSADPTQFETNTFPLLLQNASAQGLSQIQVAASLGPVSTVSVPSTILTAPVPRFRDFSVPQSLVNLMATATAQSTGSSSLTSSSRVRADAQVVSQVVGSNVMFTNQVTNDNQDPTSSATGVVVQSKVMGGTITNCQSTVGSCSVSGNEGTVAVGTLQPMQSVTITMVVAKTACSTSVCEVDNEVTTVSDQPDVLSNSGSASTAFLFGGGSTAGVASNIAASGGTPQSTAVGAAFASPLQVTVTDGLGSPVAGVTVTFSAPLSGASAVLSGGGAATTNSAGVASVTATANGTAGSYNVIATAAGLPVTFSLTNTQSTQSGGDLAQGQAATQSSTLPGTPPASAAVDGNTDGQFFDGSVTATNLDANPWWQVDLGSPVSINSIVVWNRTDCCASRLSDYWVFASNTPFLATDTPATLQFRAGTFSSHLTAAPSPSTMIVAATQGRYVRIQLSSAGYLSLAEVQVFGGSSSGAKVATQSSTLPGTPPASVAIDGNTDGNFFDGSVTATNLDSNPWWQVDLGASTAIGSIVIWNRTDCCASRLSDYWVFVSDAPFLATDTPASLQFRAGTFASHQTTAPNPSATIPAAAQGRYLRVQLSSANYLSLAEVKVITGAGGGALTDLAQGKSASQSSTLPGTPSAAVAVDGNTDGSFFDGSVTATNLDSNPWWQVDLGASTAVGSLVIWNRIDCCASRLSDYWVFVSDTPFLPTDTPSSLQFRAGTWSSHQTVAPNPSITIPAGAQGRYVRVQLTLAGYLSLAEVQVFAAAPATNLAQGKAAAQSSTLPGYPTAAASSAVDGNTDGAFFDGSVTASNADPNAWWQVDLGASANVSSIVLWNRTDCCGSRLGDYWVFVSNTPFLATDTPLNLAGRVGTWASHQSTAPNPSSTIAVGTQGRYVRVQLTGTNNLSLAEVQVFGQ